MTPTRRSHDRARAIFDVLLVFSPVLIPAAVVLALLIAVLLMAVVQAFGEGLATGCAALATLIGLPSIGAIWLSAVLRVLGRGRAAAPSHPLSDAAIADIERRSRLREPDRDDEGDQRAHGRY